MCCRKRAAEISRTDDDGAIAFIDSEQLADLAVKIFYVISVALLAEAAKAVEILTYLRCGDVHHT